MIILSALQIIASAILVNLVWWTARKFKLEVTIHNAPIIIFYALFLLGGMILSISKFALYIPMGFIMGILIMIFLASLNEEKEDKLSTWQMVIISFIISLVWHQALIFIIFFVLNQDKIKLEDSLNE